MKKFELEVVQDTNPYSPREDDNLGTMICFHNRYELGDKTDYRSEDYDSWEELKEGIIKNEGEVVILPLYLYDHSGITISTSPFGCNWDSGRIGFIFMSKHKIKKEEIDETKVEQYLIDEVKVYDQYLTGDVWGYNVYEITTCDKGHEHKELVESCYGYYGHDECEDEGKSVLQHLEENNLEQEHKLVLLQDEERYDSKHK
jgi:hypothetical protein